MNMQDIPKTNFANWKNLHPQFMKSKSKFFLYPVNSS